MRRVPEGFKPPAAMIEHTVDDDPHAHGVGGLYQRPEILVCPEGRVDVEVIDQVVLMVFAGDKDGVQIKAGKAQLLDVGQVLRDAADRAA